MLQQWECLESKQPDNTYEIETLKERIMDVENQRNAALILALGITGMIIGYWFGVSF